jgi:hypothetical protein
VGGTAKKPATAKAGGATQTTKATRKGKKA